jgi:hypothetical protein
LYSLPSDKHIELTLIAPSQLRLADYCGNQVSNVIRRVVDMFRIAPHWVSILGSFLIFDSFREGAENFHKSKFGLPSGDICFGSESAPIGIPAP